MNFAELFATLVSTSLIVNAHMQMVFPPPRRSTVTYGLSAGDTNMMAPLNADGSNFPCKNYGPEKPTAVLQAGSTITVKFEGSTYHDGGHCEFSISYNDRDFVAIDNVLHNCFTGFKPPNTVNVRLPANLPPCERCTFAWTWVNRVGNRELYMNCADIKIENKNQPDAKTLRGPRIVVANVGAKGNNLIIGEGEQNLRAAATQYYESSKRTIITISPGSRNAFAGEPSNGGDNDGVVDDGHADNDGVVDDGQGDNDGVVDDGQGGNDRGGNDSGGNGQRDGRVSLSSIDEPENTGTQQEPAGNTDTRQGAAPELPPPAVGRCAHGSQQCAGRASWRQCAHNRWYTRPVPPGTACTLQGGQVIFEMA